MASERKRRRSTAEQRSPGELAETLAQMAAATKDPPPRRARRFGPDAGQGPLTQPSARVDLTPATEPKATERAKAAKPRVSRQVTMRYAADAAAQDAVRSAVVEDSSRASAAPAVPAQPAKATPPEPQWPAPQPPEPQPPDPRPSQPQRPEARPSQPQRPEATPPEPQRPEARPPDPGPKASAAGLVIGSQLGPSPGSARPRTEPARSARRSVRARTAQRPTRRSRKLSSARADGTRFASRAAGRVGRQAPGVPSRRPHFVRRLVLVALALLALVLLLVMLLGGSKNNGSASVSDTAATVPVAAPTSSNPAGSAPVYPSPPPSYSPSPPARQSLGTAGALGSLHTLSRHRAPRHKKG